MKITDSLDEITMGGFGGGDGIMINFHPIHVAVHEFPYCGRSAPAGQN